MQEAQESLSSLLGASREPSLREQIEEMNSSGGCCSLTYEERIIGFAGCVISGLFLNMLSMIRLTELKCKYFVVILASTSCKAEWELGMFAILARLQVAAVGDASFAGGATGGFVNTSDEGSQALSSALSAASGGGSLGMSDSAFASKLIISPELIAREKSKAKQGFCETALWNCTDLYGPGS